MSESDMICACQKRMQMTEGTWQCCGCDEALAKKENKRGSVMRPRGWHVNSVGQLYCPKCWNARYVVRAITLPVWGVEGMKMSEFWRLAWPLWHAAAAMSNWASSELFANDIVRNPGTERMPAMPPINLYQVAQVKAPAIWAAIPDKASAGAIVRHVEQAYRASRWEVVWRQKESLRSYKNTQPYPITGQSITLREVADEDSTRVVVHARVGGARHVLQLARGVRHARNNAMLQYLHDNPEMLCECALLVRKRGGDATQGTTARANSGGARSKYEMLFKLAGWFPVQRQEAAGTLRVHTAPDSLLVAVSPEGDRIWTYNADHARNMVSRHVAYLNRVARLSDDRKAERRKPRRDNRELLNMYQLRADKNKRRLASLIHEVTASVVAFAKRMRVATIDYDGTDISFAASFPWRTMRTILEQKCRANGLDMHTTATEPDEPEPAEVCEPGAAS